MRPIHRLSLIKRPATSIAPIHNIGGARKTKRDVFESFNDVLPEIYDNFGGSNFQQTYSEPDPYVLKNDKRLELKSNQLKDTLRSKSEKLMKFKAITENIEFFIDLDEKYIDFENIRDHQSSSTDGIH